MVETDIRHDIHATLMNLRGIDQLKRLIWDQLNYDRVDSPITTSGWREVARQELAEAPVLFATAGEDSGNQFVIVRIRLTNDRLLLGSERLIVMELLKQYPSSMFIFSNRTEDQWHFVNVKDVKKDESAAKRRLLRRIAVSSDERLRTATERISLLDVESMQRDLFGLTALEVQRSHDLAFNVEEVTKEFFKKYQALFNTLKEDLAGQTGDPRWAHDASLQLLNRIMFLYFIQRKGWLGNDKEFLGKFWSEYQSNTQPKRTFYREWLSVMFFNAFNKKGFHGGMRQFPESIYAVLSHAPYLNGGLFTRNELDQKHAVTITDDQFRSIFDLLDHYNFTISEDSPLDQEVAVDPEMIGKVYESLVNVQETTNDQRSAAGIFYTPRTEIDLMCRLTLVDYMANHLDAKHKNTLYEIVFALDPVEKLEADKRAAEENLWFQIDNLLRTVTMVDPACGSGSFLVGMLHVLDDLQERAGTQLGISESLYERRKRIIGQSLYGVDVKDWAIHVAELRLWLALTIDAEFTAAELAVRAEPLLPHFSFKLRVGDSLVQEVGGVNFGQIRASKDIPSNLKARVTRLKNEKLRFYNNDPAGELRTLEDAHREEQRLFADIMDHLHKSAEDELKKLRILIAQPVEEQTALPGTEQRSEQQLSLQATAWKRHIAELEMGLSSLTQAKHALKSARVVPFVWEIAFVEIFEGGRDGFDIVIGNPPYVSSGKIDDPLKGKVAPTLSNRSVYKQKIIGAVQHSFPGFFEYRATQPIFGKSIAGRSDLYVYFFFKGLSLVAPRGSFCFITSNSWLDTGFGATLQEFLLKHSHIKFVIDNEVKKSFSEAEINTVISLLAAPTEDSAINLQRTARFVVAKVPFEQILHPALMQELEEAGTQRSTNEYRVNPISQMQLLSDGLGNDRQSTCLQDSRESLLEDNRRVANAGNSVYSNGKWGGRYLNAPDIYWIVLSKGSELLEKFECFLRGERYLNTGGADGFFILHKVEEVSDEHVRITNTQTINYDGDNFHGLIEKRFITPLVKDFTRRDSRVAIRGYDSYCLVVNDGVTPLLSEYIKWGEKQGYNERSGVIGRVPWYRPTNQMISGAPILVPRSFNDAHPVYHNPNNYLSLRFYRFHTKKGGVEELVAFMNSTLVGLFIETLGNKSLGQGVLDFFMADFLQMPIPIVLGPEMETAFEMIRDKPIRNVWELSGIDRSTASTSPTPLAHIAQLDSIVFDKLRLTSGERDAVYESVIKLVEVRLNRAASTS